VQAISGVSQRLETPLAATDAYASTAVHAGAAVLVEAPKYPAEYSSEENLVVCNEQAPVINLLQ